MNDRLRHDYDSKKYAKIERERAEGEKTAQSKTVNLANETRGYPSGKCQRETASVTKTNKGKEVKQ